MAAGPDRIISLDTQRKVVKVLMITMDFPPIHRGGEGVFSGQMAQLLPGLGVNLHVIAPEAENTQNYDTECPAKVHRVKIVGKTVLTRLPSLAYAAGKFARRFSGNLLYTLRPCFQTQLPTIAHFHMTRTGCFRNYLATEAWLPAVLNGALIPTEQYMIRNARRILTLTSTMKHELHRHAHSRVSILGNGVDLNLFKDSGTRNFKRTRLLYAGRLDLGKGILDLLLSFKDTLKSYPNATLAIAGTGPMETRLNSIIKRHHLTRHVFLLGKIPMHRMPDLYRNSDLLVLPSHYEGFGLVILEAMACGTPVISSNACVNLGQPRFKTGDQKQLTSLITHMVSKPQVRENLSKKGLILSREYGWDRIASKLVTIFREVLKENAS